MGNALVQAMHLKGLIKVVVDQLKKTRSHSSATGGITSAVQRLGGRKVCSVFNKDAETQRKYCVLASWRL